MVKNLPANIGDVGSIPGSGKFPWRRKWQATPVFLPGKSHRQRNLAGYNPWACKRVRHDLDSKQHYCWDLAASGFRQFPCKPLDK